MKRKNSQNIIIPVISILLFIYSCKNNTIEGEYFLYNTKYNYDTLIISKNNFYHIIRRKSDNSIVYENSNQYSLSKNELCLYNFYINYDTEYIQGANLKSSEMNAAYLGLRRERIYINEDLGLYYCKVKP
jgi:hypothetical protein